MQVKKFEAPTIQEALETIKRELGPEAIILQTKKLSGGFGLLSKPSVEVTAAVSERSIQKKKFTESRMPEPSREAIQKLPAGRQAGIYDKYVEKRTVAQVTGTAKYASAAPRVTATRYIEIDVPPEPVQKAASAPAQPGAHSNGLSLEEELVHLKRIIHEMKSAQETSIGGSGAEALVSSSALNSPALQGAFEELVVSGIEKRFALALVRQVAFELGPERSNDPDSVMDQLAVEIMQSTRVASALEGIAPRSATDVRAQAQAGPTVLALVGPTGVGKTTTVAKIASEALLRRGLRVGLVNLDNYKVAAFDQLGTYARILNIPFRSAQSVEDLKAAFSDFHTLDLVIVDTTGRSQRDPASLQEMKDMLAALPGVTTQLVLSVTTRDTELYDMCARFSLFQPRGLILSKLDEGTVYGAIYNVSRKVSLPLSYFTTGQRVPEDIEEATRERVAALILDL